jgi:pimeloyl-ACP methyl ester carboxylesterase
VFGGYAEFLPTVRFAVTGRASFDGASHDLARDPLNAPVVFLNVLEHLDVPGDRGALADAWLAMVHRTWGKMELKALGARDPVAQEIAAALPPELRSSFLRGCCLEEPFLPWLDAGLEAATEALGFLDPAERLAQARCPVVLVHGKDDDVIPYFESMKLARALPAGILRSLHLTGLYGHTGASRPTARELASEAVTLARMLVDLGGAPQAR